MKDLLKNIATGILITGGINVVVFAHMSNISFWLGMLGAVMVLAGLDLRYYTMRIKARVIVQHNLDKIAEGVRKNHENHQI